MSQPILKAAAGVAALAAIAFGASAIAGASGSNRSGPGGGAAATAAPGGAPGPGGNLPGGPPAAANGTAPGLPPGGANGAPPQGAAPGGPPPLGRPVTGAVAAKVKAAALERYPGTVERIEAVPGLGYVAHVFRSGGGTEVHVLVNGQFQVTGLAPRPGGAPGTHARDGSSS